MRSRIAGMAVASAVAPDLHGFEGALRTGTAGILDEMDGWPVALLSERPEPMNIVAEVAAAAFADAGEDPDLLRDTSTAVVVASTKGDIEGLAGGSGEISLGPFAGRIGASLGLTGHLELVSCACSSGGIALARAKRLLDAGCARRVLVVGYERLNRFLVLGFGSLGALSREPARPYDEGRDGMSLGEGAAAILLVADDKPGIGISGAGQSCDATGMIRPAEDGSGLAAAIRRALDEAGFGPEVGAVCGHGTGTIANDSMEAAALRAAFGDAVPTVFGLKGATGHTMGCCGVTEAIACAVSIRGGFIPGTVGYESGNEGLDVADRTREAGIDRLLSVNAGFGGINVALVIDRLEA